MRNHKKSLRIALLAIVFAGPALADARDDLLATDRAFSALSAEKGNHAAFLTYMTEDARLFQGAHPPILGKEAAAASFAAEEKADPSYPAQKLVWSPLEAEVSTDGTLGTTRGTWSFSVPKTDGARSVLTGYYVTAWRKQPDGRYKFCLDIGGADKPGQQ